MSIALSKTSVTSSSQFVYRVFDFIFSLLALVLLFPLLVLISILVKFSSEGSILYKQKRVGFQGTYFFVYKFRTMVENADEYLSELLKNDQKLQLEYEEYHKLKIDPRITKIGHLLRRTSLDELPQFINVLRGEMSLVGPRPIVELETSRYGKHLDELLSVLPGMTGLWQIWGRNDTTYEERVFLDMTYIRKRSIGLNIYIILSTCSVMVKQKGAY